MGAVLGEHERGMKCNDTGKSSSLKSVKTAELVCCALKNHMYRVALNLPVDKIIKIIIL